MPEAKLKKRRQRNEDRDANCAKSGARSQSQELKTRGPRPQAKSSLSRPPTQGGEIEIATSKPRPRDGRRASGQGPRCRGLRLMISDQEIEAKGVALGAHQQNSPRLPSRAEAWRPRPRSEDSGAKSAKPGRPRHERKGKARTSGPGCQEPQAKSLYVGASDWRPPTKGLKPSFAVMPP